jgi:hypothetical protein
MGEALTRRLAERQGFFLGIERPDLLDSPKKEFKRPGGRQS